MKIPTIGWVKLKEFGYIPTDQHVSSGHVTYLAGRYYVSVLVDMDEPVKSVLSSTGIGIDLGVKELATVSDGKVFSNINKTKQVKKLEKSLKRQQRRLSRKYESFKKRTKRKKGVATRQNIRKQALKVAKLYHRMERIREDYENKVIIELVKTKPAYIALEDLNIRGMMKNRHLSKAIASQRFYSFQTKLMRKAKILGIEIRMVDRWYPSSKMCHTCGCVKKDLKLKDRIYQCNRCGMVLDRDFNAALNIRDANQYVVA